MGGEGSGYRSLPLVLPLELEPALWVGGATTWPLEDFNTCITRAFSSDSSARFMALPVLLACRLCCIRGVRCVFGFGGGTGGRRGGGGADSCGFRGGRTGASLEGDVEPDLGGGRENDILPGADLDDGWMGGAGCRLGDGNGGEIGLRVGDADPGRDNDANGLCERCCD